MDSSIVLAKDRQSQPIQQAEQLSTKEKQLSKGGQCPDHDRTHHHES